PRLQESAASRLQPSGYRQWGSRLPAHCTTDGSGQRVRGIRAPCHRDRRDRRSAGDTRRSVHLTAGTRAYSASTHVCVSRISCPPKKSGEIRLPKKSALEERPPLLLL